MHGAPGQQALPISDAGAYGLLQSWPVNLLPLHSLAGVDRAPQVVPPPLAGAQFSKKGLELTPKGNGARESTDLAFDTAQRRSQLSHVIADGPRCQPRHHALDDGGDDMLREDLVDNCVQHCAVYLAHIDADAVPALAGLVVPQAAIDAAVGVAATAAQGAERASANRASSKSGEQVLRIEVAGAPVAERRSDRP